MEEIRILAMNPRLEAVGVLMALADGDDIGQLAQSYMDPYGLSTRELSGVIELFQSVRGRLSGDFQELSRLFGKTEELKERLWDLFDSVDFILGSIGSRDFSQRAALFAAGKERTFARFHPLELSEFLEELRLLPISDAARWLLSDACLRYDEYRARMDFWIDRVQELISDKMGLLQPAIDRCAKALNELRKENKLFDSLARMGLRLETDEVEITPWATRFSTVTHRSSLGLRGQKERASLYVGVLADFADSGREGGSSREYLLSRLRALDDQHRLNILFSLARKPLYGQDIVQQTGLSAGTVSHHMGILAANGLVSLEKQGTRILYRANREQLQQLVEMLRRGLL